MPIVKRRSGKITEKAGDQADDFFPPYVFVPPRVGEDALLFRQEGAQRDACLDGRAIEQGGRRHEKEDGFIIEQLPYQFVQRVDERPARYSSRPTATFLDYLLCEIYRSVGVGIGRALECVVHADVEDLHFSPLPFGQ